MAPENQHDLPADQVVIKARGVQFGQAQLPTFILMISSVGRWFTTVSITTNVLTVILNACQNEGEKIVKLFVELPDGDKIIERFFFNM
jgi:hypothetical protein